MLKLCLELVYQNQLLPTVSDRKRRYKYLKFHKKVFMRGSPLLHHRNYYHYLSNLIQWVEFYGLIPMISLEPFILVQYVKNTYVYKITTLNHKIFDNPRS